MAAATTKPKPKPRAGGRLRLADLSDDDRRALLEEAREASKRNPTDVDGYDELSDREKAVRALMDARDHLRGCPVQEGTMLGRVEGYDSRKPPNHAAGEPGGPRAVIRCIECGGTTVYAYSLDDALERADEPNEPDAGDGDGDTP